MADRFGLSIETIDKIVNVFKKYPNILKAVVYGSRAKGTYKPGSDIDLVLFGENISLSELLKIENELDDLLLPYEIDLSSIGSIADHQLLEHIDRVGKIFYPKSEN